MDTKSKLRDEYRKTWETFSLRMKRVQELAASGDSAVVEGAVRDAELALAAHKEARDRLAAVMAPEKMLVPMSMLRADCRHKQTQPVAAA